MKISISSGLDYIANEIGKEGEFIDITKADYDKAHVTSYTGGATWLKLNDKFVVIPVKTPVEIDKFFRNKPNDTIRGEIYKKKAP
jgi:hypothetical protein